MAQDKPNKPHKTRSRPARPAGASRLALPPNATLLYGHHPVAAALANPERACRRLWLTESAERALADGLAAAQDAGLDRPLPERTDRAVLDATLPPGAVHQGALMLTEPLPEVTLTDVLIGLGGQAAGTLLLLDQVSDPHNVGAILRSAAAFEVAAVIVHKRGAPELTAALAKSAAGAAEYVPMVPVPNLARAMAEMHSAGIDCIGLDEHAALALPELRWPGRCCLVLGAEGRGLRKLTRENCAALAALPLSEQMPSLNVSNAAAIALYARVTALGA